MDLENLCHHPVHNLPGYVSSRERWHTGHKVPGLEGPDSHRALQGGRPLNHRPVKVEGQQDCRHLADTPGATCSVEHLVGNRIGLADGGDHIWSQECGSHIGDLVVDDASEHVADPVDAVADPGDEAHKVEKVLKVGLSLRGYPHGIAVGAAITLYSDGAYGE